MLIQVIITHIIADLRHLSDRMDFCVDERCPDAGRTLPLEAHVVPLSSDQLHTLRSHQTVFDRYSHSFFRMDVHSPQQQRLFFVS